MNAPIAEEAKVIAKTAQEVEAFGAKLLGHFEKRGATESRAVLESHFKTINAQAALSGVPVDHTKIYNEMGAAAKKVGRVEMKSRNLAKQEAAGKIPPGTLGKVADAVGKHGDKLMMGMQIASMLPMGLGNIPLVGPLFTAISALSGIEQTLMLTNGGKPVVAAFASKHIGNLAKTVDHAVTAAGGNRAEAVKLVANQFATKGKNTIVSAKNTVVKHATNAQTTVAPHLDAARAAVGSLMGKNKIQVASVGTGPVRPGDIAPGVAKGLKDVKAAFNASNTSTRKSDPTKPSGQWVNFVTQGAPTPGGPIKRA